MADPQYMTLRSLPVPILWIPGAAATYDLTRAGEPIDDVTAEYVAIEDRLLAEREARPLDAPEADRRAWEKELRAQLSANATASALAILEYTRCEVTGLNPTPVAGQPATWAHVPPKLIRWLAHQGRVEAADQWTSPLALLRQLLS